MRSCLFVPADSERKLAKGLASGADCLFIDLEDSVAASGKAAARANALAFLTSARKTGGPSLYVRVNALDTGLTEADLDAVMPGAPDGIVLPKSASGADVQQLGAKLAVREARFGLADRSTHIIPIITETAASLFAMQTYKGASPRLAGLTWGAEDLSADLGAETYRLPDGGYTGPYALARTLTLIAAVAAGVAPVDTVFPPFRDMAGFRAECEAARRDGFTGKMAIHPDQVQVINEVFTPSPEAIAKAHAIVAAFAGGATGVTSLDGEMLDQPHLAKAKRLLARAPNPLPEGEGGRGAEG